MDFIYDLNQQPFDLENSHGQIFDMVGYNKEVLEVGCASGYMTKIFAERGCAVTAMEISSSAGEIASKYTKRTIIGDADDPSIWDELAGSDFEVITFGDVLEHLKDPLAALRRATKYLQPTGMVIVSIPNVAHGDVRLALLQGRFDAAEYGLLDKTHLRFFTASSLRRLLREAGLVPVEIRRVIIPIFGTELGVNREDFDPRTVTELLEDPEVETYQFVVRAVPDNGTQSLRLMSERIAGLESQLTAERTRRVQLEDAASGHEEERAVLALGQLAERKELDALMRTKTFRWSTWPRRIWGLIRSSSAKA